MASPDTPLELSEIRRLMADSQRVVSDRGTHFIAWGVVLSTALFVNRAFSSSQIKLQQHKKSNACCGQMVM